MKFAHSDKYGYITCCPSNLGTSMRASVLLKIPKLSSQPKKLDEICAKYMLQARGKFVKCFTLSTFFYIIFSVLNSNCVIMTYDQQANSNVVIITGDL